ncbi:hypothetical protein MRB53_002382 [Persea americana]|uniref:Uncharacterized protein n=1 Tax=Persea americana TaxID=3435 RepID=A0ACC2MUG5_PERAE|nr:hypothetical protein MRB53_002382 [Persea americana]
MKHLVLEENSDSHMNRGSADAERETAHAGFLLPSPESCCGSPEKEGAAACPAVPLPLVIVAAAGYQRFGLVSISGGPRVAVAGILAAATVAGEACAAVPWSQEEDRQFLFWNRTRT